MLEKFSLEGVHIAERHAISSCVFWKYNFYQTVAIRSNNFKLLLDVCIDTFGTLHTFLFILHHSSLVFGKKVHGCCTKRVLRALLNWNGLNGLFDDFVSFLQYFSYRGRGAMHKSQKMYEGGCSSRGDVPWGVKPFEIVFWFNIWSKASKMVCLPFLLRFYGIYLRNAPRAYSDFLRMVLIYCFEEIISMPTNHIIYILRIG